ncbi:hypothetical protein RYX36_015626, partial [Vicia faba]
FSEVITDRDFVEQVEKKKLKKREANLPEDKSDAPSTLSWLRCIVVDRRRYRDVEELKIES